MSPNKTGVSNTRRRTLNVVSVDVIVHGPVPVVSPPVVYVPVIGAAWAPAWK